MAVELWAAVLERPFAPDEDAALAALLPPARRARLDCVPGEKRDEVLAAYALLALAVGRRTGGGALPAVTAGEGEKPCFPALPELHFSLSHTRGAALAGLAERPLGVDVERVRPLSAQFMRRLAGTEEPAAFFSVWTRREARFKRDGARLADLLRREPPLAAEERVAAVDIAPGYAAAAAWRGGERSAPPVHRLTQAELLAALGIAPAPVR